MTRSRIAAIIAAIVAFIGTIVAVTPGTPVNDLMFNPHRRSPTATSSPTPLLSSTSTRTVTLSPTRTFTNTPTITPTPTNTPTPTLTPTNTPLGSFTPTVTNTPTITNTPTVTLTRTNTPTFTPTFTVTPTSTPAGRQWYVSRNGTNANGTTWTDAWAELNQINWNNIAAGDTINIDGGSTQCASPWNATSNTPFDFPSPKPGQSGSGCGMLYNTTLAIGKSGTSGFPIVVKLGADVGRSGTAVFFGGRTSSLPACLSTTYTKTTTGNVLQALVTTGANSYVTLDGVHRSGFVLYGADSGTQGAAVAGIDINNSGASFLKFQNMEVFDNGVDFQGVIGSTNVWQTDGQGAYLNGHDNTFSRMLIHDNGQDALHERSTAGSEYNLSITDSWLYGSRENPNQLGWGFAQSNNQTCQHVDGLQTFAAGTKTGLVVQHTIVGPYIGQALYPADSGTLAHWNTVTFSDDTLLSYYDSINGDSQSTTGWTMTALTAYHGTARPDGTCCSSFLDGIRGTGHVITNSIAYGQTNDSGLTGFSGTSTGNYYWLSDTYPGATNTNPSFTRVLSTTQPHFSDWQALDLTTASGKGSAFPTLASILARIDTLNTP